MSITRSNCRTGEIYSLVFILLTTKLFTNQSLLFAGISGTGAPLSAICSGLVALVVICISTRRFYRNPDGGNIISRGEKRFGTIGKYLICLILIGYLALSSAYVLNQFSHLAKLVAFPTAPLWFVAVFFAVAAFAGASAKEDGILRTSKFIVPFLLITILVLLISVLCQSNFLNLFPILGAGVSNTVFKGLSGITFYSDIALVFLINPFSTSPKSTKNAIIFASTTAIIINALAIITFTAKIPYPLSQEGDFPMYLLLKEVYYGRFFQRIDAIFLLASSFCGMFSLSVNFCLITKVLEQAFDITHRQAALFPVIATTFLLALGYLPIPETAASNILFPLTFVVLGIVLFISILTGKGVVAHHEK